SRLYLPNAATRKNTKRGRREREEEKEPDAAEIGAPPPPTDATTTTPLLRSCWTPTPSLRQEPRACDDRELAAPPS
ncbi:unnamed protein product, partial [Urochloa humidicola]